MRLAHKVLEGAGVPGDDRFEDGTLCLLVRRQCNPRERALVPEPYITKAEK